MKFILVDIPDRIHFFPFSHTRSIVEFKVGIFSIKKRWELLLESPTDVFTTNELQELYTLNIANEEPCIYINPTVFPTNEIVQAIKSLQIDDKLIHQSGKWIASHSKEIQFTKILLGKNEPTIIQKADFFKDTYDLLKWNARCIVSDFEIIRSKGTSEKLDPSNRAVNVDQIYIEPGAQISCANLNASEGPIYIGKNAVIMEGASLRGPISIGERSVVKMNASIYGATSVGDKCLVGGEIKNSIILGYSNKGHDGYLGDSIIGFWCNIGAGACNSNIKNTASDIQMWNEHEQNWQSVGTKMGMMMGDYSRLAILSRVNTGSYIGVSANVFGQGLLPKHLPDFTWGTTFGYQLDKALEDINNWMVLKGENLTNAQKKVLTRLFERH